MLVWLQSQYDLNENNCWVWKNFKDAKGYGQVFWNGTHHHLHRLYWLLSGRTIPDGLVMCHGHKCVTACFNPEHLRADTYSSNQLDKHRDGTMVQAKLTREQVLEIRDRTDKNQKELAKEFGVNPHAISDIKLRKTWAWL